MRHRTLLPLALAALAACHAADAPTRAALPEAPPARAISQWPYGGTEGFHFLPWTPPEGSEARPFDATLSPVVEVCRMSGESCGPVLASFSRTSGSYGRRVTVDLAEESYDVEWPTASTGARAGEVYRVTVRVGARRLGYADVVMVRSFAEFFTTDTNEFVPWAAGWELPVSFRVSRDIPGSVVFSSSSLQVGVGDGKPLTARVLDLHGDEMELDPWWYVRNTSSAAGPVVEVDSGLVVGMEPGTARVSVWIDELLEGAVPVTVTDTRRAWSALPSPDDQGNRALWGPSDTLLFAASHTGVLRLSGGAWAHVEAVRWRGTHDVFGFGPGDIWAVGDDGMILRMDGAGWRSLRFDGASVLPHPLGDFSAPARKVALRAVWGTSASSVYVVGDGGTALRFDGTTWRVIPTGVTADLTDVWGLPGGGDPYATTSDGRVLRLGATGATPVAGLQAPGALHAVWGTSASNLYVVGDGGALYRFNGLAWTRTRLPTRATLYDVRGTSAGNVFVAGAMGALYRWDGTRWAPEKSPGGNRQLFGLWTTPSGRVLAAGGGGLLAAR